MVRAAATPAVSIAAQPMNLLLLSHELLVLALGLGLLLADLWLPLPAKRKLGYVAARAWA